MLAEYSHYLDCIAGQSHSHIVSRIKIIKQNTPTQRGNQRDKLKVLSEVGIVVLSLNPATLGAIEYAN